MGNKSTPEGRAFPLHFGLRGLEVVDGWHVPSGKEKRGKMKMDVFWDGSMEVNWFVDIGCMEGIWTVIKHLELKDGGYHQGLQI